MRDLLSSDEGKQRIDRVKQLTAIADELNVTTAQLTLAWTAKNPNVSH